MIGGLLGRQLRRLDFSKKQALANYVCQSTPKPNHPQKEAGLLFGQIPVGRGSALCVPWAELSFGLAKVQYDYPSPLASPS